MESYFQGPNKGAVSFPYTSLSKYCYRISSVAKYHRGQIMVLYCRPNSQFVNVPVWSCQNARGLVKGAQKGGIIENSPPPSP